MEKLCLLYADSIAVVFFSKRPFCQQSQKVSHTTSVGIFRNNRRKFFIIYTYYMIACSKEMLPGNNFPWENHSLSKIVESACCDSVWCAVLWVCSFFQSTLLSSCLENAGIAWVEIIPKKSHRIRLKEKMCNPSSWHELCNIQLCSCMLI